ncbi:hypothetical protein [Leptolyngbya sp. FACHB-261]|uniref:hypothetical protein n=1 Tax=Leptolyngbya sp. FACHB-261 TaxID=2692806 RepID=UPI001685F773|nr:hypothetical protein [Leptolyngbya sp. FACHB-261]MBD2099624.1 hypothetical protein [Leptolyngbya sp. FACHB-261]
MKLDKIISLANSKFRLRFLAMERSLRAAGCQLPLWVIPYDNNLFELPVGSKWWVMPEILDWLEEQKAHRALRKYQCLTVENYQFVDADVCFLKNPEDVLESHLEFITSCGHWRDPNHTYTETSKAIFAKKSTTWQMHVFNSGQFACDSALYSVEQLKSVAMQPEYVKTCVQPPLPDQPGLNLLVFLSNVSVTNLMLPPIRMESTWAGDYPSEYNSYWSDLQRKPYLIHWAGTPMDRPRPINDIFYSFLTQAEKAEWDEQVKAWSQQQRKNSRSARTIARRFKRALHTLLEA